MKLRVLSVGYPLAPVGPDSIGGAEQILAQIDRALSEAGHESIVVAPEGSQVTGILAPIPRFTGAFTDDVRRAAQQHTREAIDEALRHYNIDVIHMHGVDFFDYLPDADVPVVATLHLPPQWYPPEVFTSGGNLLLHCVSAAQRKACPDSPIMLPDIPNGIPIPPATETSKHNYAASLGRICPEKGFHLAAEACAMAGVGYLLAGAVYGYAAHEKYFERDLKPRLDGVTRRFIGPVGGDKKTNLLAAARCLLVPSLVAETSSLVTMEALASGTPVIAFKSGALPELIEHGETGFLVDDAQQMAHAIEEVGSISSDACREYAREHFSSERMTRDYLDLYSRLTSRTVAVRVAPPKVTVAHDVDLSSWREVFASSADTTPFQAPEWIDTWWEVFGSGTPLVVSVHQVGVMPMYVYEGTVRFIGAGTTDYLDLIARKDHAAAVAEACIEHLASCCAWNVCDLDEVRPESALVAAGTASRAVAVTDSSVCPVLDLQGWTASAKLAKNIRYSQRRLGAEFETLDASRSSEFLDHLIRLHEHRWEHGIFSDPNVERFHHIALPRLAAAGLVRMHVLRRDRKVIAALYCLVKNRTTYYYIGGFDPEFEAYSPGSLLIDYAIRCAIAEGHHTFDFLRGAERYKYSWGAKDRRNKRLLIRSTDTAT